jgi:hypothetical protein
MKRVIVGIVVAVFLAGAAWAGQQMSVQVRTAPVKADPSFTARNVDTLKYGTRVDVMVEQNNWAKLSSPNGWMHLSALTKRDIGTVDKKYTGSNASYDEVALAGKGFNPKVESQYKQSNRSLASAYNEVDRVETFTVGDSDLRLFAQQGKLTVR